MAKGDQEKLMKDINTEKTRTLDQNKNYMGGITSRLGSMSSINPITGQEIEGTGLYGQQEKQLKQVTPQYQNFANTGGISKQTSFDLGRSPGSITDVYRNDINNTKDDMNTGMAAAYRDPNYGEADQGYRQLAATGGIDPTVAMNQFNAIASGQGQADRDIINKLKDTSGMFGDVNNSIAGLKNINFGGAQQGISDINRSAGDLRNIDFGGIQGDINSLRNVNYGGVQDSIGRLNEFAKTGGVTDEDKARINRPIFEEFEKTGGYTPEQLADIKREANATIGGNYNNLQDALSRQKATSGGYGASFGSAASKMARDAAIASGDQDLSTNINLGNAVRQGRMAAGQQISANQLGINAITSPAMLQAMSQAGQLGIGMTGQQSENAARAGQMGLDITGQQGTNLAKAGELGTAATNAQLGITNQQAQNLQSAGQLGLGATGQQIGALGQAGDLSRQYGQLQLLAAQGNLDAQRMIQQGKIAGLGGLADTQTAAGQYGLNKAGQVSDTNKAILGAQGNLANMSSGNISDLARMQQQGQMFGTSGLADLYKSTTGQISDADKQYLAAMGLDQNSLQGLLALQQKGAGMAGKNQQMFGNIMQGVGAAAGMMI